MKNKQNNFINFMFYTTSIISFSIFLIIMLTLKNECRKNEEEILQLNNLKVYNTNIIKEMQSKKDFLLTEHNIKNALSNRMIAVVPETLLVKIYPEQ